MKDYRALRLIGDGAKVFGVISIVLAILGALLIAAGPFLAGAATEASFTAAFTSAGVALFSGVGSGIVLVAFGQLIHLLMDLAESAARTADNSERTADLLEKAMAPAKAPKPETAP